MAKVDTTAMMDFIAANTKQTDAGYQGPTARQIALHLGVDSGYLGGYLKHRAEKKQIFKVGCRPEQYYIPKTEPDAAQPKPVVKPAPIEQQPTAVSSLDAAIEALANALVQRVQSSIEGKISEIVEGQVLRSVERMTAAVAEPVKKPEQIKIPRVMVYGLLNGQADMIQREFEGLLDVRCLGSNENSGLIKSIATHVDRVFVMQDFSSHSSIALMKSAGVKPVTVAGGMTTLRSYLTRAWEELTNG